MQSSCELILYFRNQLIMVIFTFLNEGISFDPQGNLCKCRSDNKYKQAGEKAYSSNFRDSKIPVRSYRRRHYHLKNIYVMSYYYHNPGSYHKPRYPFVIAVHKHQDRKYKVKYQHSEKQTIVLLYPQNKIGDLFGYIGIPN